MRQIIGFVIIVILLNGCSFSKSNCGVAYFGGEIINPNNGHLILYDASNPVDTLHLDKNNRFLYEMENLDAGLYSFVHGGEYQVVLLEPNDSIMIRLNTFDFDESLVFTGKGSKKNNFLLSLFVEIEKENKTMYEMGRKLEPNAFQDVLDSIRAQRYAKLDKFNIKYETSPLFQKVSKACIDYNYYAQKEIYPFRHFGNKYVSTEMLPDNFYDFRDEVDYDDEDLKDFYPYYNFLFPHFNNLALDHYLKKTGDSLFDRRSVHYHMSKLKLIDSLIKYEPIKNNLLKYSTRNFLSNSDSSEESEVIYTSFMQKCSNEEHSGYITNFYQTLKKLEPGHKLPDIELVNSNNESVPINSLFDGITVLYFWTKANRMHASDSHAKVNALREAFPEVQFVSVNVNNQDYASWKRMMEQYDFNQKDEYMLRNPELATKILALYNIYKVMIVDENMVILDSNSNLFRSDFRTALSELTSPAL